MVAGHQKQLKTVLGLAGWSICVTSFIGADLQHPDLAAAAESFSQLHACVHLLKVSVSKMREKCSNCQLHDDDSKNTIEWLK